MNKEFKELPNGEILLRFIDMYNIAFEKQRNNLKHAQKFDIGKIWKEEPFNSFFKLLENKDIEIYSFIENLSSLRFCGTFYNIQSANEVIEGFKKLQIDVPEYVVNCYREVEKRTNYINSLIDDNKYEWDKQRKKDFNDFITKELQEYTIDDESRLKYLKTWFNKIVEEIKTVEEVLNEYGYNIDSFFEGEIFKASKDELNDFFLQCEIKNGTINEFPTLVLKLIKYIDKKNELKELKLKIKNVTCKQIETLKEKVEKAFVFMKGSDPRIHKKILNKTDFRNLIDWVKHYFENEFEFCR